MTTENLIGFALIATAALLCLRRPKSRGDPLDRVLFHWAQTPFTLRDLHASVLSLGMIGSGKSSGSGRLFQDTVLSIRNSGGLVIASKPEDRQEWMDAFERHGRAKDLVILGPGPNDAARMNFLDVLGGDATNLTGGIEILAEMASKNSGGSKEPFWDRERKRTFQQSIVLLMLAGVRLTGHAIQKMIVGAAIHPKQMDEEAWKAGFHKAVLDRATAAKKSPRDQFDFEQAHDFFTKEWPLMADKTRSNIMAECMGVLFTLNSGMVRDLIGTETNFTPSMMEEGKWLLVDAPLQLHGDSGRYIGTASKYLVQRFILSRHTTRDSGPIVVWIDECQNYLTSYDPVVLAEQRSHKGACVYLTQSIPGIHLKIGKEAAESLLPGFATKIFHKLADSISAEYASSLLGLVLTIKTAGGPNKDGGFDPNFSEDYLPALQSEAFLGGGMRTSGGVVDAIVVMPHPFKSTGQRYAFVSFQQKR